MERRTFVKLVTCSAVACGLGFAAASDLFLLTDEAEALGPQLADGLDIDVTGEGADIYKGDTLLFKVNREGADLLSLADGKTPLSKFIDYSDFGSPADIALFFVTIGEAGYLKKRVEVNLVEARL